MKELTTQQQMNFWSQLQPSDANKLFSRGGTRLEMYYKTEFAKLEELAEEKARSVTARTQAGKRVDLSINPSEKELEIVKRIINTVKSLANQGKSYQLLLGLATFAGRGSPTIEYASLAPTKLEYLF